MEATSQQATAVDSPILVCADGAPSMLTPAAINCGWTVRTNSGVTAEEKNNVALVEIAGDDVPADVRRVYPNALVVLTDSTIDTFVDNFVETPPTSTSLKGADFCLNSNAAPLFAQIVNHADAYWRRSRKVSQLVQDVAQRRQRMHQLNEISLALTTQMDEQELLHTILNEARRIAGCEGGSLYLVQPDQLLGEALVFKLAQNDAVEFPFVETRLPLSSDSIAGYVAVTGDELNIRDVYNLSEDLPYKFNRSFDDRMGYRSQSMLVLPMRDHRNQVVGVLQFLNQLDAHTKKVRAFGEETVEVLRAIASQAAVSLQKSGLLRDINQLFESFVQASVKTIEQRDPSTSGHSFRVAETTVALLQALPESGVSRFKQLNLSEEHVREVRYAALLHDFGKIGVPEAVLVKANKLTDDRLEVIRYRVELQKERLRRRAVEQELELLHHSSMGIEVALRRVHRQLEKQLSLLDQYYDWIVRANDPNVLEAGDYSHLNEIREYAFRELDGTLGGIIADDDLLALSVRKGSLTPAERRSIQSHVVYTKEFLSVLPWPPELAQVPDIAGGHHERIDGTGYPLGLAGEQIPLASRVMAVCDVYDALTAMDRPYKPAMSQDAAFSILNDEAKRGLLDQDMVNIFINSGSYHIAKAS